MSKTRKGENRASESYQLKRAENITPDGARKLHDVAQYAGFCKPKESGRKKLAQDYGHIRV